MKKIIILAIGCSLILASCASTMETGLKRIELGMTKNEVKSLLGKNYTILGAAVTHDGNMETWSYKDPNVMAEQNKRIIVNFNDDRLVEWHQEYIPVPPKSNSPQ